MPHIVEGAHYSRVNPEAAPKPELIHFSPQLAELLGFDADYCRSGEFTQIFSGSLMPAGQTGYAVCYGGHQFGVWAGQLGDGRVVSLGEVRARDGSLMTLQLKGVGLTPYSRTADGYAVLRSSLREYLCSEAMNALGVPTTRALSLCLTGREVVRDILYQGDLRPEPGAVVCRVSRGFLRFGNFEIFAARGDKENLRGLISYALGQHHPDLAASFASKPEQAIIDFFGRICSLTAALMVDWLRVGFVHGVLNTDNISILGETIDYGPYGWMEEYDPAWTPNTTDTGGRYCFAMQPRIALWNLLQLARALASLVEDTGALEAHLNGFEGEYRRLRLQMMRAKLGLAGKRDDDAELIDQLESFLIDAGADMTLFYQRLAKIHSLEEDNWSQIQPVLYKGDGADNSIKLAFDAWVKRYLERMGAIPAATRQRVMASVNPVCVPRNYLVQLAIDDAEKGDYGTLERLFDAVCKPYDSNTPAQFTEMRPEWALNRPGCSALSCSS